MNVYEMEKLQLGAAVPARQPWGGSFWPLIQGQIANPWQERSYFEFWELANWRGNTSHFKKKRREKLLHADLMNEKELAELAPSEKYDILIGDKSFQLTGIVWDFVEKWGERKKWGFLSSIEMPEGYRLPKANKLIAFWEGICHGWALAAGTYPRPAKTVTITLPSGKKLLFYPHDIKALVSLYYANSVLQDNVLMEGTRCNDKILTRDKFGRNIDKRPTQVNQTHIPSCADVHPAVWHIGMVNLTGLQKRSFVVEIDANAPINNFPFSGYRYNFFNPRTGKIGKLTEAMVQLNSFNDPYKESRNTEATQLVGVETTIYYTSWVAPSGTEDDDRSKDKIKKQTFLYDLELDSTGKIIGGQWRAEKIVRTYEEIQDAPEIKQPDFFWVAPKNHRMYLKSLELETWDGTTTPPASWLPVAKTAHGFIYNVTQEFGFAEKCLVIPEKRGHIAKEVNCEFKYPRPQPLINVIEQLVEMSKESDEPSIR